MLRILKKRESGNGTNIADHVIKKNATDRLIAVQHKIADRLNGKAASWQPERVKLGLVFFCLLFGITSLMIMTKAIWRPETNASIGIKHISIPKNIGHARDGGRADHFISKNEYNRLEHFRVYIDSLEGSAHGREIKDSILGQRPKLLDSLAMVEQLYNKQK
jgi:hypothetical protein